MRVRCVCPNGLAFVQVGNGTASLVPVVAPADVADLDGGVWSVAVGSVRVFCNWAILSFFLCTNL
jgi:hypothetical protein